MVSKAPSSNNFIYMFFDETGKHRGYYVLKALYENEDKLRALFAGREFIKELSMIVNDYRKLVSIQASSKDYKSFRKAVSKLNIDAGQLEDRSIQLARAVERAFLEECSAIEADAIDLNLRVPGRMPCSSANLNPFLSTDDYPESLWRALVGLRRTKSRRETLLTELKTMLLSYAQSLDIDTGGLMAAGSVDASGLVRFINVTVLNQQSIGYLSAVRELLLRLARYARMLLLLATPKGEFSVEEFPGYDTEPVELLRKCVRVALCVKKRGGLPGGPEVQGLKGELSLMIASCSSNEGVRSYLEGTSYISDLLFWALFIVPSIMNLERISTLGESVARLSPDERRKLVTECLSQEGPAQPSTKVLMSPDSITTALEPGGIIARYVEGAKVLSRPDVDRTFASLRSYWTAGVMMLSASRALAKLLRAYLPSIMPVAFPDADIHGDRLYSALEQVSSSSWWRLREALNALLTEIGPIGSLLEDEPRFISAKVVSVLSGTRNPLWGRPFRELEGLALSAPEGLSSFREGAFTRYYIRTGGRDVRLAPSADLVFTMIRTGSRPRSVSQALMERYGLASRERAEELTGAIINELVRAGLLMPSGSLHSEA